MKKALVADAVLPPEKIQKCPSGSLLQDITNQLKAEFDLFQKLEHEATFRAVRIGLLLLHAQDNLKRGEFEPWLEKNIQDFGRRHAFRFMKLAGVFLAQKQVDRQKAYLLCEAQPEFKQSASGKTGHLVQQVFDFIQDKSLNDLFDEYGIKKRTPKPTGGANMLHAWLRENYPDRPELIETKFTKLPEDVVAAWKKFLLERDSAGLPPGMTPDHYDANVWWTEKLREIHLEITNTQRYLNLDLEELKAVSMSLLDAKRVIDDLIKKG